MHIHMSLPKGYKNLRLTFFPGSTLVAPTPVTKGHEAAPGRCVSYATEVFGGKSHAPGNVGLNLLASADWVPLGNRHTGSSLSPGPPATPQSPEAYRNVTPMRPSLRQRTLINKDSRDNPMIATLPYSAHCLAAYAGVISPSLRL